MSHITVQGQDCHGTSCPADTEHQGANTLQLDAGMHTGREGMAAMPYFDDFDLGLVDILLISQYVLPNPVPLSRNFVWQWRRRQCRTSTHMSRKAYERGATGQSPLKSSVSMLYLRSGQYHAFHPTCSFLELFDDLAAILRIAPPYCHTSPKRS